MRFGRIWRCGKCGKIYSFEEFLTLQYGNYIDGKVPVCECGYRFSIDKWKLQDTLKIDVDGKYRDVMVSTVDLELNHGWNKDLWYETMIFVEGGKEGKDVEEGKDEEENIECNYENRYETKEEAINDHNRIMNLLKEGKYEIVHEKDDKDRKIIKVY